MKKTIGVISLILILMASAFAATPVFAKNLNLPSGANVVVYYSGGQATINLPTDRSLLVNYPATATEMRIIGGHAETPNAGKDSCFLFIELYMNYPDPQIKAWQPYAFITTDPDAAAFMRIVWAGTFIELLSTGGTSDNVKLLNDPANLQVERHGNSIYVNLKESQQIQRSSINHLKFVIPAFSMELNSYGGSFHTSETATLPSGYTLNIDHMGFMANGAFTSSAWGYEGVPVSDGLVIMHGIDTYYPPAA
jgi:hypothetical protein